MSNNNISNCDTVISNELRLNGKTSTYNDTTVDLGNRQQTYISFGPNGSVDDWAYLRQIGSSNNYHMSLDIHNNLFNGAFSFRTVGSENNPDGSPVTFFKATAERGFFNPNEFLLRTQTARSAVNLNNHPGVTTVKYRGVDQHGTLTLPSFAENGMRIKVVNASLQNLMIARGNTLHGFNGSNVNTITIPNPFTLSLIFYNLFWESLSPTY
jgi:hypothetical protein